MAAKADDIRAQAVYDCCKFDALLEFGKYTLSNYIIFLSFLVYVTVYVSVCPLFTAGVGGEDAVQSVKAAKTCCEEEIYAFNNTEQFFLVSCLALW